MLSTIEWASVHASVLISILAWRCCTIFCATTIPLPLGSSTGAFASCFSAHPRRALNRSSFAPTTNVYRRRHCLQLALLVNPSETTCVSRQGCLTRRVLLLSWPLFPTAGSTLARSIASTGWPAPAHSPGRLVDLRSPSGLLGTDSLDHSRKLRPSTVLRRSSSLRRSFHSCHLPNALVAAVLRRPPQGTPTQRPSSGAPSLAPAEPLRKQCQGHSSDGRRSGKGGEDRRVAATRGARGGEPPGFRRPAGA